MAWKGGLSCAVSHVCLGLLLHYHGAWGNVSFLLVGLQQPLMGLLSSLLPLYNHALNGIRKKRSAFQHRWMCAHTCAHVHTYTHVHTNKNTNLLYNLTPDKERHDSISLTLIQSLSVLCTFPLGMRLNWQKTPRSLPAVCVLTETYNHHGGNCMWAE